MVNFKSKTNTDLIQETKEQERKKHIIGTPAISLYVTSNIETCYNFQKLDHAR